MPRFAAGLLASGSHQDPLTHSTDGYIPMISHCIPELSLGLLAPPISTQASLSLWSPPHSQDSPTPQHFDERDDKRMSKHAVADLGQRAQTLAPAVENGGEEAAQKAE